MIIQRETQNRLLPWAQEVARASRNHPVLSLLVTALVTVVMASSVLPPRFVVLNRSPSIAIGLYVAIDSPPERGRLVEFRLPRAFRNDVAKRGGYADRDAMVLKPIAAVAGDHVDTMGSMLQINGRALAPIHTLDSEGRPLAVWRANRVLNVGEFFVFSNRVWNSFDSRYFGPIRRRDIVAVRVPWITWGPP